MNKRRKGFLKAATILSIVAASFGILVSIFLIFLSPMLNEEVLIDLYKADPTYTYVEHADGGYSFTYQDDDGIITTIDDETIPAMVTVTKIILTGVGIVFALYSAAQLTLAIIVLKGVNKLKYRAGCVIALLVLSVLSNALLEAVFIIVAMCSKQEDKPTGLIATMNSKKQNRPLGLNDIEINNDKKDEE